MQARIIARGSKVTNPESILVTFLKCKEFNCLPNAGGLLDQDPTILDLFGIISYEMNQVEKLKQKALDSKLKRR